MTDDGGLESNLAGELADNPVSELANTEPSLRLVDLAPDLFDAIESFIHQNATFESSIVQKRVIDEIGNTTDAMVAFAIPMQNTLLSMDGALRWVMFWHFAIDHGETNPFQIDTFSVDSALRLVSKVYDLGFQDAVMQHFEGSDSDEDEGDEDDEDEADAANFDPGAANFDPDLDNVMGDLLDAEPVMDCAETDAETGVDADLDL